MRSVKVVTGDRDQIWDSLNWVGNEIPLVTANGIDVASHKSIVRSDTNKIIGIVGIGYQPVQNNVSVALFDEMKKVHKDVKYHSANIYDDGQIISLRAKVNGEFNVTKDDGGIVKYVDLINGFDGSKKFFAYYSVERLICKNGLRGIVKENKIEVRHTANCENKIEEAFRIFSKGMDYFKKFEDACKVLAQKMLDKQMVDMFLEEVVGKPDSTRMGNIHDDIVERFENGKGNHGKTAWDLYNGLTEHVDHKFDDKDKEQGIVYANIGAGSGLKEKAFDFLLNMANG